MKIIVIVFIIIALSSCSNNDICSVDSITIDRGDTERYMNSAGQLVPGAVSMDTQALLTLIKQYYMESVAHRLGICKDSYVFNSERLYSMYSNIISSVDASSDPENAEVFYENVLVALILEDFVSYDSNGIQNNRYQYAVQAFNMYDSLGPDSFMNEFTDYFEFSSEQSIALNNALQKNRRSRVNLSEDMLYYYISFVGNDVTSGLRIEKMTLSDILYLYRDSIEIVFYRDDMLRAIYKMTDSSIWHSIIFNE